MGVDGKSFPSPAGNARGEPYIRDEGLAGHLQSGMEQQAQAAVRAHGESMAERIISLIGAALVKAHTSMNNDWLTQPAESGLHHRLSRQTQSR